MVSSSFAGMEVWICVGSGRSRARLVVEVVIGQN